MVGNLIIRGLVVGILAGILAFGWAKTFGERAVDQGIAFEESEAEAAKEAAVKAGQQPEEEEPEIFSRAVQSTVGLFTGVVGLGAGIGAIFAVLFAFSYGRMGNLSVQATSMLLGLYSFVSVYMAPALKYPPNPPGVGDSETIKLRTAMYFLMIALSVASMFLAGFVRNSLLPKHGSWNSTVLAVGVYLLAIAAWNVLLPGINEVPENYKAIVLWDFRMDSLAIQAILWLGTGLLFGYAAKSVIGENRMPSHAAMAR